MAHLAPFIARFSNHYWNYIYLEITPTALLVYYAQKKNAAKATRIEFTANEVVLNKLGNLNALKKLLLDFSNNNHIKANTPCIVSAPYLANCPVAEKPFALMQLALCLSATHISLKKIVLSSIIDTTTGKIIIKNHRSLPDELAFIAQHNNQQTFFKLFLGIIASGIALYCTVFLLTAKQNSIASLTQQLQALTTINYKKNAQASNTQAPTEKMLPAELQHTFNPSSILNALAKVIPDNTVITALKCPRPASHRPPAKTKLLNTHIKKEQEVIIDGASESIAAIIDFTNKLSQSGTLTNLTITTISPTQTMPKPFSHVFTLHGLAKHTT